MPRTVSGQRIGRSFVSPSGADEVSRVLDFQLGADEGIEITSVLGYGSLHDDTPVASATVPSIAHALQTLHLEGGATEDLPVAAAADADDIDTEIFYMQSFEQHTFFHTTTGAGIGLSKTPNGLLIFDRPILSPRNITHKGTTLATDHDLECGVLIFYRYVRFTSAELGVLLSRR